MHQKCSVDITAANAAVVATFQPYCPNVFIGQLLNHEINMPWLIGLKYMIAQGTVQLRQMTGSLSLKLPVDLHYYGKVCLT
jgi:hypothetical protein